MSRITKFKSALVAVPAVFLAGTASAQEAPELSPAIADAFDSVTANFNTLMNDYGWPLIALVAGSFLLVKIVKRVLGRV